MTVDIGRMLADFERRLKNVEAQSRLKSASLDDTALVVRDGTGSLRGIVGQQGDGTTAVTIVNGPPPPQPSAPIVMSVLGGVTASWDGLFTDGVLPLDWSRTEVHASPDDGFTPTAVTLQSTIETAQGATVVVPTDDPVYVRLVARSTSGTASAPSAQAGPYEPATVVAGELLDGIVTTIKLADDAVTAAKVAVGAIDSTAIQDGAVLEAALHDAAVSTGKLATDAVTAPKLAANAVIAGKIAANAVTAATIAAGAINTEKLTVAGGTNIFPDPSFEGAYTAVLVAGNSFWSQAPFGNGSPTGLRLNCAAGAPTSRNLRITIFPVLTGDQLYLAADYYASADWVGNDFRFFVRWYSGSEGTGTHLSTNSITRAPTALGAWERLSGTVTAPAQAVSAMLFMEGNQGSAGTVTWDNAVCRPIVPGVQIADGAITTPKIVAGAVQTLQLDAGAVNASKIAAGAVTTAALDALAVTADKIAANTITAGKLAAGSVDATALKADAITGKTITGGTINGAEFHSDNGAGGLVDIADGTVITTAATGWKILIDPTQAYPILDFRNDVGITAGSINAMGDSTRPGLVMSSGPFTDGAINDWRWATRSGADGAINGWRTGRFRDSDLNTLLGGYINLAPDKATLAWIDTDNPSTNTILQIEQGLFIFDEGRMLIEPPVSTSTALYVAAKSGHTGNLLRAQVNLVDRFVVGASGAVIAAGTVTAAGFSTTGSASAGSVTATGAVSAATVSTTGNVTIGGTLGMANATVSGQITKDAAWSTLSTNTGWAGYGGAYGPGRYRRMPDGSVFLRDLINRTAATTPTTGEIVATLPVGYRPTTTVQQNTFVGGSTGGSLSININTNGTITLTNFSSGATTYLSTGNGYISLNGYQYFTD
ncbi:hypothetical protein ACWFRT_13585 [Streptomyces anulatus]